MVRSGAALYAANPVPAYCCGAPRVSPRDASSRSRSCGLRSLIVLSFSEESLLSRFSGVRTLRGAESGGFSASVLSSVSAPPWILVFGSISREGSAASAGPTNNSNGNSHFMAPKLLQSTCHEVLFAFSDDWLAGSLRQRHPGAAGLFQRGQGGSIRRGRQRQRRQGRALRDALRIRGQGRNSVSAYAE